MHKIDTDTAVDGEFTDGDGTVENPATDLNAAWFNSVQRELIAAIAGVNISPSASDDAQLWKALQKIGIRCLYSDTDVDVSGFTGATVIFHDASDFEIVGSLSAKSFVVIVPFWGENSPATISVTYNDEDTDIDKHQAFIGWAANGYDELQLSGVFVPLISAEGLGGELTIGGLNAGFVKAAKRFETDLVDFEYSSDAEGLQDWQAWQLASNWTLKQVKRVRCTNAPAGGQDVTTFGNTSGTWSTVKFYPYSFRELMCVGTYTTGDYTFAVLAVNGRP